jgi:hypothetical protein
VQLLPAQLDDFGQYLFQIHRFPFPATRPAMCAVKQTTDMNGRTTPHDIRRTVNGHPHGAAADPANSGRSAASHPTFIHDQRQATASGRIWLHGPETNQDTVASLRPEPQYSSPPYSQHCGLPPQPQ